MDLFGRDKELIHKILNGILILWFLGALMFTVSTFIDIVVKPPEKDLTYEEYKERCYFGDEEGVDYDKNCDREYRYHIENRENEDFYNTRSLYIALANDVVVGFALVLLNRKRK